MMSWLCHHRASWPLAQLAEWCWSVLWSRVWSQNLSQHPAWCSVISRLKAAERVFTTTSLQAAAQTPSESEPITGQLASWLLWNTAINVSLISQIHSDSTSSANHRVITATASRRRFDPTNLGLNKLLGINIWSWRRHHQAGWLNAAVGSSYCKTEKVFLSALKFRWINPPAGKFIWFKQIMMQKPTNCCWAWIKYTEN